MIDRANIYLFIKNLILIASLHGVSRLKAIIRRLTTQIDYYIVCLRQLTVFRISRAFKISHVKHVAVAAFREKFRSFVQC